MKPGYPIPKTSAEWTTHFTQDAEIWPNHFLEKMEEFTKLSDIKMESNKERSKNESPINIGNAICFDVF